MTQVIRILHGDSLIRLQDIPGGSVQAVVCDPPYGIGFLGVAWDTYSGEDRGHVSRGDIQDKMGSVCHPHKASEQAGTRGRENRAYGDFCLSWLRLAFQVLEPRGTIKVFSGTRTFHRLAAAMVEAGFQDVSLEAWGYATGFPKSLNVSKAIDKAKVTDEEREFCHWLKANVDEDLVHQTLGGRFWDCRVVYTNTATKASPRYARRSLVPTFSAWQGFLEEWGGHPPDHITNLVKDPPKDPVTHPVDWTTGRGEGTQGSNEWAGWGTALKPAWEPVIIGRKPS